MGVAPFGTAATAAAGPYSAPAVSKADESQSAQDKENDAAAVTAVIWKELAEMSAAQAKLKVRLLWLCDYQTLLCECQMP